MKKLMMMLFAAATFTTACSDLDGIKDDVKDLQNRVEALENQVTALNKNVAALQQLLSGATVSSVTQSNGVYTVTLSNGDVLTLTQGSAGGYITPLLGVDANGYWTVSTDGGTTYKQVKDPSGNPVRAVAQNGATGSAGKDGITPQFKVDASGYWLVSYDGGSSYSQVKDASGNPVSATGNGTTIDKFFADVTVTNDLLTVKLLDGTTVQVPVVSSFKCVIASSNEIELFAYEQSREFDVTMQGVASTIVTAPAGWTAVLASGKLKITAPAATRATADSSADVAIIATSTGGYACISKIKVTTDSSNLHNPTATVTAGEVTSSSIAFTVALTDANAWKYLCKASSETAPTANEINTSGTAGSGTAAIVEGLTDNTAYTIYVLPLYDTTVGTVATAQATTPKAVVDYYEKGYTVGSVTYSKNTSGVQLLTATTTITAAGVYFLDPADDTVTFTIGALASNQLVIIGRKSNVRVALKITGIQSFNGASGDGMIFKNLNITYAPASANYLFNFGSTAGTYENFIIDDCSLVTSLNKPLSYFNVAGSAIKNIQIINSSINMNISANATAVRLINVNNGSVASFATINISNTTVWASYVANGTLIQMPTATATPNLDITVKNNSFVNFIGQPNGFLTIAGDKSLEMSKNIFWAPATYSASSYLLKFAAITAAPPMNITDNLFYGLVDNTAWLWYHTASSNTDKTTDSFTKLTTDPYAGGTFSLTTGSFVPATAYSAYGAK